MRPGREHDTTALRTHPEALPLLTEWTDADHAAMADLGYEQGWCEYVTGEEALRRMDEGRELVSATFHLLEYMDVDFVLDVDEINQRWKDLAALDVWSQIVMKESSPGVERIDAAPRTGQWFLDDHGQLYFRRAALDWHQLQEESECFWLRVYGPGDYRYKGADLGILVTRGRLQTDESQLTPRCRQLIEAIRAQYATTPIQEERPPQVFSPVK